MRDMIPHPPGADHPLGEQQAELLARRLAVLADPTRLRLLSLIGAKGEACAACEMVEPLGVSQPTVSHHLKVLRRAGLVVSERRGRWIYYRTVPEPLAALGRLLQAGLRVSTEQQETASSTVAVELITSSIND